MANGGWPRRTTRVEWLDHGWFGIADDTAEIQAALDAAAAVPTTGATVLFPPGQYKVSTVTLRPGVSLVGAGAKFNGIGQHPTSIIGTAGSDIFVFDDGGAGYTDQYLIRDMAIKNGRRGIAVLGQGITNLVLENVYIASQSDSGFYCDTWIERCLFDRVEFAGAQYGFRLVDNGTISNYVDKCTFRNVRASGLINAFRIESFRTCNSISFYDLLLNGSQQDAFYVAAPMIGCTFVNAVTEANGLSGPTKATTTGSITAGSPTLTVASATNLATSQQVTIAAAGLNGADLTTTITGISGTTVTLAANASTTVSGAEVTNMIYDEFRFNASSSGNRSNKITFVNPYIGAASTIDKVRYAINGDAGILVVGGIWSRPINRSMLEMSFQGTNSPGPVRPRVPLYYGKEPRSIAGLVGHFDANRIVDVADGSAVATWRDLSGSGADATQATGGNQPSYIRSAINGLSAVRFTSASSQFMSLNALATVFSGTAQPWTVAMVLAAAQTNVNMDPWTVTGATDTPLIEPKLTSGAAFNATMRNDANSSLTSSAGSSYTTAPIVVVWVFDGATLNAYKGATTVAINNFAAPSWTTTLTKVSLGALVRSSNTNFFNGDIGEAAFFHRALDISDRKALTNHLGDKWGITV
jgi:hypothetical protein